MGLDLNPIHAVENTYDEVTSGAHTAPTPQLNSSPPPAVPAKVWTAPDVSGDGHITVHRDHLTSAADVIRASLPDLDAAINRVNSRRGAFDSLMTWATGQSLAGNLVSAVEGFAAAGQETSDAHGAAAQNLSDTAAAYEDAETSNTQTMGNVGSPRADSGGGSQPAPGGSPSAPGGSQPAPGGSASAASGNWS